MHDFFTNSICEKTWIGIMENKGELRGLAYMWDILKHLGFQRARLRGPYMQYIQYGQILYQVCAKSQIFLILDHQKKKKA